MEAVVPSEAIVPFTYPKAFMPLTCPKVDKAVDLSGGHRAVHLWTRLSLCCGYLPLTCPEAVVPPSCPEAVVSLLRGA